MSRVSWILVPSSDFDTTLNFFAETLGLPLEQEATPAQDPQFLRSAVLRTPNEVILEIVEPTPACAVLYPHPVVSITVDDLDATRQRLDGQGIEFLTPTVYTDAGRSWTYFRAPSGSPVQLSADSRAEPTESTPSKTAISPNSLEWILAPSSQFDETVEFFGEQLGLSLDAQGTPVSDLRFHRYAQFRSGNGVVIEVVEPKAEHLELFGGPVPSITVADLRVAKERVVSEGFKLLSDVVDTPEDWGWFYFRVPGSTNFQLSGPWSQ